MTDALTAAADEYVLGIFGEMFNSEDEWFTNGQMEQAFLAGASFALSVGVVADLAALIEHALALGHLGEGSTHNWANKVLAAYKSACGKNEK